MAPIRVGIIGLSSATGEMSASPGGGWAASAHLPYLLASPYYEIVALCNSSVHSAKIAVEKYGLPSTTKTYGTPEDLANDPDVDLVACCVRVDRHYKVMKPVLEKGKDAFVEWPLAANLQEAEELIAIAREKGCKTMVGLQGRMDPRVQKLRELIKDGKIGEVQSTIMTANAGGLGGQLEPPGVDYLSKKAVGGNLLTIPAAHSIDSLLYALGEFKEFDATLAIRWPKPNLVNPDGSIGASINRDTPDHIFIQGTLAPSGAAASFTMRGGKQFKSDPNFVWHTIGTKAEVRITSPSLLGITTGIETFELYDHEKDEIETIDCPFPEAVKYVENFSKNCGQVYEAFATGNKEGLVTFEDALMRHKFIGEIWTRSEEKKAAKYVQ
ncbi:NAD(P)-binding protein [Venturia nashicola]|uniref:NAD(P)-binding protein n=1 Tax=Venturia nashicola TaxID=86259 RepID=A0A4Z1NDE7_9PEZI|nr:NAD(P)-binding protein [Venturia nashicola]TLD18778.1 NAD(P)-binding protein [Venturia nashicola]